MEKVSIVIPTYNRTEHVRETLDSMLAQTYENIEIIVVDDGSTDNTCEIVRECGGRVRLIECEHFGKPSRPRNVGIKAAEGKYVAFCDSDDTWEPHKIQRQVEQFQRSPDIIMGMTNFARIVDGQKEDAKWFDKKPVAALMQSIPTEQLDEHTFLFKRSIANELIERNFIATSAVMCKKDVLLAVGGFDETMVGSEDLDLWVRIAERGGYVAYTTEVLTYWRMSSTNLHTSKKSYHNQITFWQTYIRRTQGRQRVISRGYLARKYFEYGFLSKNDREYGEACRSYVAGILVTTHSYKGRLIFALLKLPLIMVRDAFVRKGKR